MTSSTERQQIRPANDSPFARFATQQTVLLTTFRKDGMPVGTPVSVAVDGDCAYFRTWESAGKHPFLHGLLISLIHRPRGNKTIHLELTPIAA